MASRDAIGAAGRAAGLLSQWKDELRRSTPQPISTAADAVDAAARAMRAEAAASQRPRKAAPSWRRTVSQAMQQLGMAAAASSRPDAAGTRRNRSASSRQSSWSPAMRQHAATVAKVASGGELSRIALAIAVSTSQGSRHRVRATLIFDEIDAGVGGAVAETVGRLMKQLGRDRQVLAVTHLPQVLPARSPFRRLEADDRRQHGQASMP
jgi:DNA repair protein RecN (Recombination protein N)